MTQREILIELTKRFPSFQSDMDKLIALYEEYDLSLDIHVSVEREAIWRQLLTCSDIDKAESLAESMLLGHYTKIN